MAEEAAAEAESAEAPPKKKRGKKMIIFIAAPVVLLLAAGGGLYFTGMIGKPKAKVAAEAVKKPIETAFFDLPDMLVNLNTGTRRPNYLKLSVSLQIESKDDQPKIQAVMPRVIDICQSYLRELRLEDLRGSGGLYRLREELQMRIGAAVAPVKVDDVLFKDVLVQ